MINYLRKLITLVSITFLYASGFSQNSILVNFGTNSCLSAVPPSFSLVKDPFGPSSGLLTNCDLSAQLPDIFSVFIAYNPKDNQIYIADISSGLETKIWVVNMGLPQEISCPQSIPVIPNYSYPYISNNFEFDNNGDLWSFSNYDAITGICNMDQFDVSNGNILNTRLLQFPAGNYPTAITSGDLCILPNGRMFATLGSSPSRLYEIHNYNSTSSNATATFLGLVPMNCYGIAYLNGLLEIAGTDFGGNCYYFKYDIAGAAMTGPFSFQNGELPIDNTSITASLGVTKQLVRSVRVDNTTADLTYEIFATNLGNVALNNVNVSDDLASVFGSSNISNVTTAFVAGSNAGNLQLNTSYDGKAQALLLKPGQNLKNRTATNTDYFFKLRVGFRVSNLNPGITYLNSAVGSGTIGGTGTTTIINVSDSSNNGPQTVVDPNNNGNAGDPGENEPTPFNLTALPVKFLFVNAVPDRMVTINWGIATPAEGAKSFSVEYSADGRDWTSIGNVAIIDKLQSSYKFQHDDPVPGIAFYRIRENDFDGNFVYSNIVTTAIESDLQIKIFPNPADKLLTITFPGGSENGVREIIMLDQLGRKVIQMSPTTRYASINTSHLAAGRYVLKVNNGSESSIRQVVINHP